MATTLAHDTKGTHGSKTTPKDFFLWAGVLIALYGAITSFITLLFQYINHAFPDPLSSYTDPYSSTVRISMAALIVLTPIALILMRIIRTSIEKEPGKALIWVRRWALVLTLFIAGATIAIDLITLINTFLGGDLTTRFVLKVAVVLLVAAAVFMHFLADLKGYWISYPKRAMSIGIAIGILVIASIVSGFLIIGTPHDVRLMRYDDQKVNDLQSIQYQVVNYWQQKQALPKTLGDLNDPLSGFVTPIDPQAGDTYRYEVRSKTSFALCATFNKPSVATGKTVVRYPASDTNDNWQHGSGEQCFERTIDPERYPPVKTIPTNVYNPPPTAQ